MCAPGEAGAFAGRVGIVITPNVERMDDPMTPASTDGRVVLKSVSADYRARKGRTDSHWNPTEFGSGRILRRL
jgi:hypothetical protein